jgi:hypothetical protein
MASFVAVVGFDPRAHFLPVMSKQIKVNKFDSRLLLCAMLKHNKTQIHLIDEMRYEKMGIKERCEFKKSNADGSSICESGRLKYESVFCHDICFIVPQRNPYELYLFFKDIYLKLKTQSDRFGFFYDRVYIDLIYQDSIELGSFNDSYDLVESLHHFTYKYPSRIVTLDHVIVVDFLVNTLQTPESFSFWSNKKRKCTAMLAVNIIKNYVRCGFNKGAKGVYNLSLWKFISKYMIYNLNTPEEWNELIVNYDRVAGNMCRAISLKYVKIFLNGIYNEGDIFTVLEIKKNVGAVLLKRSQYENWYYNLNLQISEYFDVLNNCHKYKKKI